MTKRYLGDSVYVDAWDDGVVLTTNNGLGASNIIYLELQVIRFFLKYLEEMKESSPCEPSS